MTERLSNGTLITVGPSWAVVTLPTGEEVHAHPSPASPAMAERLGYGDDVAAMTRDHDPLHARLTDWLGLPHSFSLRFAAGVDPDSELAGAEEDAVLAVQRFRRLCIARGILTDPLAPSADGEQ